MMRGVAAVSHGMLREQWPLLAWACLAMAAAQGFGRFAYAMFVPPLHQHLRLNTAQLGWLGTSNYAGYTAGALLAGWCGRRLGRPATIRWGLLLISASLAGMAPSTWYPLLLALRFGAGLGAGLVLVLFSSLVLDWAPAGSGGLASGAVFAGVGAGIFLSGAGLPPLLGLPGGWRWSWLVIAAPALLAAAGVALWVREPPHARVEATEAPRRKAPLNSSLARVYGAYALYGFGYVTTATFLVAYLQQERGFGTGAAGAVWALVGAGAIAGALIWGVLADRLGSRVTLIGAHVVLAASVLAPLVFARGPGIDIAALLFGATFVGIATLSILLTRRIVGAAAAPGAIGVLTACFAVGQSIAPALAGAVAQASGSLAFPFLISAAAILAGGALLLPRLDRTG